MKYPFNLVRVSGLRNPIQVKRSGGLRFYKIGRLNLSLSVSKRRIRVLGAQQEPIARFEVESILFQCALIPILLILIVESVELCQRFLP